MFDAYPYDSFEKVYQQVQGLRKSHNITLV